MLINFTLEEKLGRNLYSVEKFPCVEHKDNDYDIDFILFQLLQKKKRFLPLFPL